MQLDKVIVVKTLFLFFSFFNVSNDFKEDKILIFNILYKTRQKFSLCWTSYSKAQLQMFYNNIKNTLFLHSVTHTCSGLSLGAFPQGKKWVYGEWCLGTKRSISCLWHWIRRAWTDFDVHFQRHAIPHSKFSFDKWKCPRSTQPQCQKLMSFRNMKLGGENNSTRRNQTRQQGKNIFLTIKRLFNGINSWMSE